MKNDEDLQAALEQLVETLDQYVQQQARIAKMINQIELLIQFMKKG